MKKRAIFLGGAALALMLEGTAVGIPPIPKQVRIDVRFVEVASPGNAPDVATGSGSVGAIYTIGRDDITVGQYTTFLNAVAKKDPYGLYTAAMATNMNIAGILRSGKTGGPYSYAVIGEEENPITEVSWLDAARFCNWLHNGQPLAPEGPTTTETGAYTLNGDTTTGLEMRSAGARYWIPTLNEWYKAAYYNPATSTYDTWTTGTGAAAPSNTGTSGSNEANITVGGVYAVTQSAVYSSTVNYLTRVGMYRRSRSAFDTADQGGDVAQWTDTTNPGASNLTRFIPGGGWDRDASYTKAQATYLDASPTGHYADVGFRVASTAVPVSYGQYAGLTSATDGLLNTSVEKTGAFSSSFTVGDVSYLFTGKFSPELTYTHTYNAHNQSLAVNYTMGVDEINATLVLNGTGDFTVTARRNPHTLSGYPSPDAGKYNYALLSNTDPLNSTYYGYGVMTVTPQGQATLAGTLADGTPFSEGTVMTGRGDIPVYIPTKSGMDSLAGCIHDDCGCLCGPISWDSPHEELAIRMLGSIYQKPVAEVRALNLQNVIGNGLFLAYGAGQNYLSSAYFTLEPSNAIVPVDLGPGHPSFNINAATGAISGAFYDPSFLTYVPISGVVLQKQNIGLGFFQPGAESGQFQMYANPQFGAGTPDSGLGGVTTLPTVKITSPINGLTINLVVQPSISFAGTASAKDGIGSVSYQVLYQGEVSSEIAATGSGNWSFTYTPNAGATGVYDFFLKAKDVAGNESNLKELQIFITPTIVKPSGP